MKKLIILSAILTTVFLTAAAQPNGGFENWSTVLGILEPDNWQTGNALSILSPSNPLSVFRVSGIDKHSGNYALKLQTVFLHSNPDTLIFPDSFGVAFTGKIIYNPIKARFGYPYTSRPEKLEFWAKYQPVGNDSAEVGVALKKWNGIFSDTVAYGSIVLGPVSAYTFFQISLIYRSSVLPDTAAIGLVASKDITTVRIGSTLFIDDMAYTGLAGIEEQNIYADKVKIFPNPARDNVTINAQIEEADNVQVIDASGKPAGVYKIHNYNAAINTGVFAEGIYSCEIRDKKNKILAKGKFTVVK